MERFVNQLTAVTNFESYKYFHNFSFSFPVVHEINMIVFKAGLIFTTEILIECKKVCGRSRGSLEHEFWGTFSKFYSDITFYLMTFIIF